VGLIKPKVDGRQPSPEAEAEILRVAEESFARVGGNSAQQRRRAEEQSRGPLFSVKVIYVDQRWGVWRGQ